LAVGIAGHAKGILLSGIGSAVGGNITGIALSGLGTAAGSIFTGIGVAGIIVTSGELRGGFAAPVVSAIDAHGIIFAPALFKVQPNGSLTGVSVSAVNAVRGSQHGLTIGIVNYARSLRGAQIGLINIVQNAGSHKVLPFFNWGTDAKK
jgi:hypothetical protein